MQLVDTHCHLHFANYDDDREAVLKASYAAGVNKVITVGCSLADSQKAIELAAAQENVWASIGVHPHDALHFQGRTLEMEGMLFSSKKVVAVGEIGLDYYKNYSPRQAQIAALRQQIEIGHSADLPFIFHVREAWDDFWPIVDEYKVKHGVIHSFSADRRQLDEALNRDFFIGLNGIMTFTKDEQQLEAAKAVPSNRLLLETDAPFLTPKPYRGERCEPKHIRSVAEFLADLRGETLENLAKATTANAESLFGIK